MALTLDFVRQATTARCLPEEHPAFRGNSVLNGVSTDTRTLTSGALYIALAGDTFDGHTFLHQAAEAGAAAALVHRIPDTPPPLPLLLVEDTLVALGHLAAAWRDRIDPLTIGITGSAGKTTVKEMTRLCLMERFGEAVHATAGNFNNHIGLPLTILAMPESCTVLVLEMGMSGPGEIDDLAKIAKPSIGAITTIAAAHLAGFENLEGIARAKAELLENLPADGHAVIPGNSPFTDLFRSVSPCPTHTFSGPTLCNGTLDEGEDLHGCHAMGSGHRTQFTLHRRDEEPFPITLNAMGSHTILNALTASEVARLAGARQEDIQRGLEAFTTPKGRGSLTTTDGGWTVVDDTYNANPAAVTMALEGLSYLCDAEQRVVVLGDMLELGPKGSALHRELATEIRRQGIARVFTTGPLMAELHEALQKEHDIQSWHAATPADLIGTITPELKPGDVVLVKGSRGMRLEHIVNDLTN
ncbi:MAG: UDP-N-acetylmuramoyl-tripeptide--D-alanyl-D-alanine ligase [Magnetococcales bacterium]|nr:UDP-N-acetylmuramoyl-tripeptide--D-alanyl-D-alanine ligase [Magnetococcales bacterium]